MAETVFPGVYVEEIGAPRAIEGVPTSVAAFLGETMKGPHQPILVGSVREFEGIYGQRGVPGSWLVPAVRSFFANGGRRAWIARIGGGKGGVTAQDYAGRPEGVEDSKTVPATGLTALATIDEIGLVAAPGTRTEVQRTLVTHCEALRDRIAILDAPHSPWDARTLDPQKDVGLASSYAAYYAPWIAVDAPDGKGTLTLPPSGAVCGIIAHVDEQCGLWKAPANEPVADARGLDVAIDEEMQALLNPRGVNVMRVFPGRGIRLWGARTLARDSEWRYVSVRRLAIFLEQSLHRGLQWVEFEPNGEQLWARMRQLAEDFLYRVWLGGALLGAKAEQAFYVRCDRTGMTQIDIDNGRIVMEIGFAPMRPAEFIVLRLSFKAG